MANWELTMFTLLESRHRRERLLPLHLTDIVHHGTQDQALRYHTYILMHHGLFPTPVKIARLACLSILACGLCKEH